MEEAAKGCGGDNQEICGHSTKGHGDLDSLFSVQMIQDSIKLSLMLKLYTVTVYHYY